MDWFKYMQAQKNDAVTEWVDSRGWQHPDDGYCYTHEMFFDKVDGLNCPTCDGVELERNRIKALIFKMYAEINEGTG